MNEKLEQMNIELQKQGKCAIAFSGGVDSTFLLAAAVRALGKDNVLALTAVPPYVADWEIEEAEELAADLGVRHEKISLPMADEVKNNPEERCYLCKSILFKTMKIRAEELGFSHLCDGSNADDKGDYRPGMRALKELGIASPMLEADLTKEEIRDISKEWNLSTWDKPPYACLLTRIPHNTLVKNSILEMIEKSEKVMMEEGFPYVRVRFHGDLARIEIPTNRFREFIGKGHSEEVNARLKALGFRHVALDLGGYKMGNMNSRESR